MKRRAFLSFGLAGGLVGLGAWRTLCTTQQEAVVAVLRKRLNYLQLDEANLRRFAQDAVARQAVSGPRLRLLAAAGPLYSQIALSGHDLISEGVRHGEERVVTLFLLSSDFFQNGRDETRPVRYVSYYDPVQACGNPFARPIGSPAV
jgi:hypothetical protein